jgi:hypothetical protein
MISMMVLDRRKDRHAHRQHVGMGPAMIRVSLQRCTVVRATDLAQSCPWLDFQSFVVQSIC